MIANKQIKKSILFAKQTLEGRLKQDEIHRILYAMQLSYKEMKPHLPKLKSYFNKMLLNISIDSLAFYKAMLTELHKDKALKMIDPFVSKWMDAQFNSWIIRYIYKNRFLHRIFRYYWFTRTNKINDIDGQKFEYIAPSGKLFYGVNVIRCGHVKFLNKMDAPELAPIICRADFYIQKFLPTNIKFKRSQVIAEGAAFCDFRYVIED